MEANTLELEAIKRYKHTAINMLQYSFPHLTVEDLTEAVDHSILSKTKNPDAYVHNNYKNKTINSTLLEMSEYILSRQPIITASGVIFMKHGTVPNPLYNLLDKFINARTKYKKEMFRYPKGSEQFQKYNLLQLLAKLDSNAIYGILGAPTSVFYNLHVATSTTTQGRACISNSIMLFESFLANNIKFGSLNEVVTFIDNVVKEERTFNDRIVLDGDISLQESYFKVMSTCGFEWIPTEKEMFIVWEIMCRLTQEDLNRLFYKNNLYYFCDNQSITRAIEYILTALDQPFLDPNKPPKEIEVELNELLGLFREYVYHKYQVIDKMDRAEMMIRDSVLIVDTDSCIVSLDAWYRYNLDKVYNVPMTIKTRVLDPTSDFADNLDILDEVPLETDYDFYTDEMIQTEKLINPIRIVPQDGLRYSIINIIAYCLGQLVLDYMVEFSKNYNSYAPERKCLMIMKNEFLFKRVLLTDGKKNYAAIQEMQEGNLVPKDKSLAVTGLSINKSTLPLQTRNTLKKILYEDILEKENINQLDLLKNIVKAEKDIYDSLMSGKKEYYKPLTVKSIASYDSPMSQQGIKASIVYNALRGFDTEALDLEKRNGLDIIKVKIDKKTIEKIKDKYPDKYNGVLELMKIKEFASGIDTVALPLNVEVPEWIIEFVDHVSIIIDNMKNFPLESVGLYRMNNDNISHSNILKI